jgi:amino acid adenylation domain-containing protein
MEGRQWTYGKLHRKSQAVGNFLLQSGLEPGNIVGICAERSIEFVAAMLGILKAGCAYLPLDPDFPEDRLIYMLKDTNASMILARKKSTAFIRKPTVAIIDLEDIWAADTGDMRNLPFPVVSSTYLAYVMYTSGSTGNPKGVPISHGNVICFLYSMGAVTSINERRIGTTVATLSFDTSVEEIFSCLCFGGTLHIIRPQYSVNEAYFARYLTEHRINTAYILPDFIEGVARHLKESSRSGHFKCMITGLAPKKEKVLHCMKSVSDAIRVLNAYGPTEVTYGATAFEFEEMVDPESNALIGRPFPNYTAYIVDKNLQPVPVGILGELLIGGNGLSRGYLNQPDLTAEKFLPDPFSGHPGDRVYRTGDLVRYLPDGNIELLGRIDDQVKIRGYRIEPGEIESVLKAYPDVLNAVVIAYDDDHIGMYLCAYVVAGEGKGLLAGELRGYLKTRLPAFMVPSFFLFPDAIPLMPNGKVNRKALPLPDRNLLESDEQFVPARTAMEKQLVKIWADILGREQIGIHDDFFALGGHSLLAIRLFSEIEKVTGKNLKVAVLFQAPTIDQLARIIQNEGGHISAHHRALVPVRKEGSNPPFFYVPASAMTVMHVIGLVKRLGNEQPFYGLQPRGMENEESPHDSVEEMAAWYLDEILEIRPKGPYLLGGRCFGGVVAFEMARQLLARGCSVGLLSVFDTVVYPGFHQNLKVQLAREKGVDPSSLRYRGKHIKALSEKQNDRIQRVMQAHDMAREKYVPKQPYPGKIVYFWGENSDDPLNIRMGWRHVAKEIEIIKVPGNHRSMYDEPNVQILAERMKNCLERVWKTWV